MELYRYELNHDIWTGEPELELKTFQVAKTTPKGYWIKKGLSSKYNQEIELWKPRWVTNDNGNNIFARTTELRALVDFICRRKKYINRLQHRLTDSKVALKQAELKLRSYGEQ